MKTEMEKKGVMALKLESRLCVKASISFFERSKGAIISATQTAQEIPRNMTFLSNIDMYV